MSFQITQIIMLEGTRNPSKKAQQTGVCNGKDTGLSEKCKE